jgi:adenylate cyclase
MLRQRGTSYRILLTNLSIILTVTLLVLLFTEGILFDFPPIKRAELSLTDLRFQRRGTISGEIDSSNIIIVEISQESFKSLPEKWPWPKSYYTRLVRNLKRAGARAVGLDIVFSTPDPRDSANEEDFRRALREVGNTVLAGTVAPEQRYYRKRETADHYGNIFIDSTSRFGIVNIRTDVDGILRRYIPFTYDANSDRRLPAFSMAILNTYFRKPPLMTANVDDDIFQYQGRRIPKYDETSFLINYCGPSGLFHRINIADVLDDKDFKTVEELSNPGVDINTFDDTTLVPNFNGTGKTPTGYLYNGTFTGKIVLVGSTMPEEKDLFPVPIGEGRQEGDNVMFGVEINANVIQQLLEGNFIRREPLWMTIVVVFGLSIFSFTLTSGLKAIRASYSAIIELLGVAIVLSEMVIIYWGSIYLFIHEKFLNNMMSLFLAVVVSYIASTIYNYMTERKQKVLIKGMFSHYVNPTIVDELVADPGKLRLGGERKELTVVFSDIQNFTRISEQISPEYLVQILNEYLNLMTAIIFANQGTLDKYEGDAILAFWGAPIPQADHALRACRAAIEMQQSLQGLRGLWVQEGKPLFHVRIGINTGEMIVGNMGGTSRFDYTVIGDSVNIGSRLEGANRQYGTGIIISEHTYKSVHKYVIARELDMLLVSGKTEPIRVYELIGMKNGRLGTEQMKLLEFYAEGLRLYRQREWQKAIVTFRQGLAHSPGDRPSQLYIERSELYLTAPPPPDWNGVFILETK